jgi:hypothetical protein
MPSKGAIEGRLKPPVADTSTRASRSCLFQHHKVVQAGALHTDGRA